jgi:hypothetical protein
LRGATMTDDQTMMRRNNNTRVVHIYYEPSRTDRTVHGTMVAVGSPTTVYNVSRYRFGGIRLYGYGFMYFHYRSLLFLLLSARFFFLFSFAFNYTRTPAG